MTVGIKLCNILVINVEPKEPRMEYFVEHAGLFFGQIACLLEVWCTPREVLDRVLAECHRPTFTLSANTDIRELNLTWVSCKVGNTKQLDVVVTLLTYIREVLGSILGRYLQSRARIVLRLGNDCLLQILYNSSVISDPNNKLQRKILEILDHYRPKFNSPGRVQCKAKFLNVIIHTVIPDVKHNGLQPQHHAFILRILCKQLIRSKNILHNH
jgi:hypothetical protein